MVNAAGPLTALVASSRANSRRGRAWLSRQSRFSALLSVVSAIALVAVPGTTRAPSGGDGESWTAYPAIHATASLGQSVAQRATPSAPSHGRAAQTTDAALGADALSLSPVATGTSRSQRPTDPSLTAQLIARGYDATAPPLA